jgi:hypothetical protein
VNASLDDRFEEILYQGDGVSSIESYRASIAFDQPLGVDGWRP